MTQPSTVVAVLTKSVDLPLGRSAGGPGTTLEVDVATFERLHALDCAVTLEQYEAERTARARATAAAERAQHDAAIAASAEEQARLAAEQREAEERARAYEANRVERMRARGDIEATVVSHGAIHFRDPLCERGPLRGEPGQTIWIDRVHFVHHARLGNLRALRDHDRILAAADRADAEREAEKTAAAKRDLAAQVSIASRFMTRRGGAK